MKELWNIHPIIGENACYYFLQKEKFGSFATAAKYLHLSTLQLNEFINESMMGHISEEKFSSFIKVLEQFHVLEEIVNFDATPRLLESLSIGGRTNTVNPQILEACKQHLEKEGIAYIVSKSGNMLTITKDFGVLDLTAPIQEIFGDVVKKAYAKRPYDYDTTSKDFDEKFSFHGDYLSYDGQDVIIEFINGVIVEFSNSEWASMNKIKTQTESSPE